METETKLSLTVSDLEPQYQKSKDHIANPRYFHLSDKRVSPEKFWLADLITFTRPDGSVLIMRDRYSRLIK
jgi:hypothetical protein